MADSKQLRRLVQYNQWADERILAAIDGVAPEELTGRARRTSARSRGTCATP